MMSNRPLAIFTAGPVGAGKSLVADLICSQISLVSLDADAILDQLAHVHPGCSRHNLRPLALKTLSAWQDRAIENRASLLINTTAADLEFVLRHKVRLEDIGYRCVMVAVVASETDCRERNRARANPRPVAAERKFTQVEANLPELETEFAEFLALENSGELDQFLELAKRRVFPWLLGWV